MFLPVFALSAHHRQILSSSQDLQLVKLHSQTTSAHALHTW
jgi:hypothetical protein